MIDLCLDGVIRRCRNALRTDQIRKLIDEGNSIALRRTQDKPSRMLRGQYLLGGEGGGNSRRITKSGDN